MDNEAYRQDRANLAKRSMHSLGLSHDEIRALLRLEAVVFTVKRNPYSEEEFRDAVKILWETRPAVADYLQTAIDKGEINRTLYDSVAIETELTKFIDTAVSANADVRLALLRILTEDNAGLAKNVINKLFNFIPKKGKPMQLHQIEEKIKKLKAAERLAEERFSAIINHQNFELTLVSESRDPSVVIHELVDNNVWDVLKCRAKEKVDAARKAIAEFEAKFQS